LKAAKAERTGRIGRKKAQMTQKINRIVRNRASQNLPSFAMIGGSNPALRFPQSAI
jgi:hypothetical protein